MGAQVLGGEHSTASWWAGPTSFRWGSPSAYGAIERDTQLRLRRGYAASTSSRIPAVAAVQINTWMRNWGLFGAASPRKTFRG